MLEANSTLVLGAIIMLVGFGLGWFLRAKRLVILTEDGVKRGIKDAEDAGRKRAIKLNEDYERQMKEIPEDVRRHISDKLGLDMPDSPRHTNQPDDDSVSLTREVRPL